MARVLYCLECNAVVGEISGGDGESPGSRVAVCQTCAQHGGPRASLFSLKWEQAQAIWAD